MIQSVVVIERTGCEKLETNNSILNTNEFAADLIIIPAVSSERCRSISSYQSISRNIKFCVVKSCVNKRRLRRINRIDRGEFNVIIVYTSSRICNHNETNHIPRIIVVSLRV